MSQNQNFKANGVVFVIMKDNEARTNVPNRTRTRTHGRLTRKAKWKLSYRNCQLAGLYTFETNVFAA